MTPIQNGHREMSVLYVMREFFYIHTARITLIITIDTR